LSLGEIAEMKSLPEIGEFGLINRIRKWTSTTNPGVVKGIGDDVAVIEISEKSWLVTTDLLIEGIHFERSWMDPFHLGRKALFVNVSDIAAMGGTPKYFLISLGLPKNLPLPFITSFYQGLRDGAKRFGVDLIGGDTSLSKKIIINICLLGEGKKGNLLFRSGAKVGDDLFISGTLGDAALGLRILKKNGLRGSPKGLVNRQISPSPRIHLGQAIAEHRWATAMIDVSDGLLIDTNHLLEESGVGAHIWEDRIPLSTLYQQWVHAYSKNLYQFALRGGEDYELLFTAPPEMRRRISRLALSLKIPITKIGEILPRKEGLHLIRKGGRRYSPSRLGFEHFRK
jgi:thiamine-monophosphate kinase